MKMSEKIRYMLYIRDKYDKKQDRKLMKNEIIQKKIM